MPDHDELIRSDGERMEIIPTPDSDDAETSLNRRSPWWGRRLQLTGRAIIGWLAMATLVGLIIGVVIAPSRPVSREASRFFNVVPQPTNSSLPATPMPRPTFPPTRFVEPLQLASGPSREMLVSPCNSSDIQRKTIVISSTGADPEAFLYPETPALFLISEDARTRCYIRVTQAGGAIAPQWQAGEIHYMGRSLDGSGFGVFTLIPDRGDFQRQQDHDFPTHIDDFDVSTQTGDIVYSDNGAINFVYNTDLSDLRGSAPRWSPDGLQIAYLSQRDPEGVGIYASPWLSVLTLSEGRWESTDLVNYRVDDVPPSWRRDGESVAFVGRDRQIYRVSLRTRSILPVTREAMDIYAIDWLSNGRIAFAALVDGERGALFVTDLDGNVRQVTPRIMGLESFDWR